MSSWDDDNVVQHEEWNRIRERQREHSPIERPWDPENIGVQAPHGTFGGENYGGVFGRSPWGSGAEQYSITNPYGNEWYMKQLKKGRHVRTWPTGMTRSDALITEDVCDHLKYHSHLDASGVEVVVEDGEVTLTGIVPDRRMKEVADDVTEHVSGVKSVRNYLHVAGERTDRAA